MTEKEINTLESLLKKLKKEKLTPPNTPYKIWTLLLKIIPAPAVEVVISTGKNFLLTHRKDDNWDGWHIPGGFLLVKETIEEGCNRISEKELGIKVKLKKIQEIYVWKNHPYASAVSIVCICDPLGDPHDGRFFAQIPKNTIKVHKALLKRLTSSI